MKRKLIILMLDVLIVGISAFLALGLRSNFTASTALIVATVPYAIICMLVALAILPLVGLNKGLWRYAALSDLARITLAASGIVLASVAVAFAINRLDDVARSIPAIQLPVLICLFGLARAGSRLWHRRGKSSPKQSRLLPDAQEHVLVVGVGPLAELYLRAIDELAIPYIHVVGILAQGDELPGRQLTSYKVLGSPNDLLQIVKRLEVHGVFPTRIVVTERPETLSTTALNALLEIERSTPTVVQWVPELLGIGRNKETLEVSTAGRDETRTATAELKMSRDLYLETPHRYDVLKRAIDIGGSLCLIVILAPALLLIAILVALDVGFPIVFWQLRPGRFGYPFKVYKFRTMHGAHKPDGSRVPDHQRTSRFGSFMRRYRLDELPQLLNVLMGDMSFVGPRPLLAADINSHAGTRLAVRPGVTGWAQVNGGRELSSDDKAALDVWYVHHQSLALDVGILVRTLSVLLRGEAVDPRAIDSAREVPAPPKPAGR